MLSERHRPQTFNDFVGQPVIGEIREACADPWLFEGCGERWLFESDGIAGCGKTSAAYVTARALGCSDLSVCQNLLQAASRRMDRRPVDPQPVRKILPPDVSVP